jgi:hypothetical protein
MDLDATAPCDCCLRHGKELRLRYPLNPRIIVPLALLSLMIANGKPASVAAGEQSEYFHDFRGHAIPSEFNMFGVTQTGLLQAQPEGLRITLPAGFEHVYGGVGFRTAFGFKGDFEVTTAMELLDATMTKAGVGTGVEMYVAKNGGGGASVFRQLRPGSGASVIRWMSDKNPGVVEGSVPCEDKVGRLRLKRTGNTLAYLWAPGLDGDNFQEVQKLDFGTTDIDRVRVGVLNGRQKTPLDARLVFFRVSADMGNAPTLAARRGGLTAILLGGLAVTMLLVFTVTVWIRRRGRHAAGGGDCG